MEPLNGFLTSSFRFLYFLPFFFGLLLLGIIKGIIFCPLACLIIAIGNSSVIVGLWPAHGIWTIYCILSAKLLGPLFKIVLCLFFTALWTVWPLIGIMGSILTGAVYGFLAPLIATFDAVGEGKTDQFEHCIRDGTVGTIKGSCTVVRDFTDVCFHSYFSLIDDLLLQESQHGKIYDIRLYYLPVAVLVGALGIIVDMIVITTLAIFKSPFMLFKGWLRLIHDLIGREGPFLETACVPIAGLAILLWPVAVLGAVACSAISSIFLGAYASVIMYQESSIHMGLNYIVFTLALFDEYSNDILDMKEGSCFPRLQYQKNPKRSGSLSRHTSISGEQHDGKHPPSRSTSLASTIIDLNPLELLEHLFEECKIQGKNLVSEGLITDEDIEDSKSNGPGSRIISIGLPAYCILQVLLKSIRTNSDGFLLSNETEVNSTNRPRNLIFDWFFDPLMIIKEQIKAERFSDMEEDYLCKLVLLNGDPERLKNLNISLPLTTERKLAEIDALARRLQGITKSISRYPTFRRRFMSLVRSLSSELDKNYNGNQSTNMSLSVSRSSSFLHILSQKSFGSKRNNNNHGCGPTEGEQLVIENHSDAA